jgi:hypothetical protein
LAQSGEQPKDVANSGLLTLVVQFDESVGVVRFHLEDKTTASDASIRQPGGKVCPTALEPLGVVW